MTRQHRKEVRTGAALITLFIAMLAVPVLALAITPSFITFESGQVRPIAMSPDGTKLFAVNTPDNRLAIFNVTATGVTLQAEVPVGLEPVAVAAPNNNEVWVVNHLSDSVSIVTLNGIPHVTRTLLVGDEPRDIVFAGTSQRAFITTAHRGQQRTDPSLVGVSGAGAPQLKTPGTDRADVWVFDPASLGNNIGGLPLKIVTLFGDTPRALAVSPDKKTVYAAVFMSGNQTTTVNADSVCNGFKVNEPCTLVNDTPPLGNNVFPGGLPGPSTNHEGKPAPDTGLIVQFNNSTGHWEDELGRNWDNGVRFTLPDLDVFAINADTLVQSASFAHVGTTLFNMAVNPVTGKLYVSNTEARNLTRFEGPGVFGGSTVQGRLAESRITVISGSNVLPRHLNKHINYSKLANDPTFDPTTKQHSLATPTDMTVSSDGATLYVAAFGSSKIGVFDTASLENDSFDPKTTSANYIAVSGGGPSGVVLDEARRRLYVFTRFDNAVSLVDLRTKSETGHITLHNPEPASVVDGRSVLYDAFNTSANGEASCSSCHIFGDFDNLAWDLGDPDEDVKKNPIPIRLDDAASLIRANLGFTLLPPLNGTGNIDDFHPMKGPMTTQTLRGLVNAGAMHWRGDRADGFFGIDAFDTNLSFMNFIVAFQGLVGNATLPPQNTMQAFTDFQLQVALPPNPVRQLDNSLTASEQLGLDFFAGDRRSDGLTAGIENGFNCNGCHVLDPAQGFFGGDNQASFEAAVQTIKIPHFRNLYQKLGMFGFPDNEFFTQSDSGPLGDQIRGFGFTHDGSVDTLFRFLTAAVFEPDVQPGVGFPTENTEAVRIGVEDLLIAFDTDLAPIVGQQVTLTTSNANSVNPRIDLLIVRAKAPFESKFLGGLVTECDLVAKVAVNGRVKGFLYDTASNSWQPDDGSANVSDTNLRAMAATAGQEVTFTAVPPGSGVRIGINRTLGVNLDGEI